MKHVQCLSCFTNGIQSIKVSQPQRFPEVLTLESWYRENSAAPFLNSTCGEWRRIRSGDWLRSVLWVYFSALTELDGSKCTGSALLATVYSFFFYIVHIVVFYCIMPSIVLLSVKCIFDRLYNHFGFCPCVCVCVCVCPPIGCRTIMSAILYRFSPNFACRSEMWLFWTL